MAEHLSQGPAEPHAYFNNMGKPISFATRQRAFDHCVEMGLDSGAAMDCVSGMAEQLQRDKPYEAQATGMRYLDLTGTYRAMAALLA